MSFCPILMKLWLIEEQKSRLEKYIIFLVTMQLLSAKTPISTFPNMTFQLHPIITPLILDQLACSLPKNVTTFHREQDGIIHFCLSPNKSGVLALWIFIFTIKVMDFSKQDYSTSFKLPKHPFYWDWDKNEWFHIIACEK